MKFQFRAHNNNGTSGIVHPFSQQVLPETPLFALEHIAQRFERTVTTAAQHRASVPPVVKQGIHRLLEHALFITENDFGGAQFKQTFQTIVPVDDASVQVVQITGGVATAVKRHQRAQVRRNDRDHIQYHPNRIITGLAQYLHNL